MNVWRGADMAIQNVIGDSFRGATWVAIHNGGGTGWGEAINGGFGYVTCRGPCCTACCSPWFCVPAWCWMVPLMLTAAPSPC